MKQLLSEFARTKRLLLCVDSDGCAMDSMDIKHKSCFGPKAVEVWKLQQMEEVFLKTWNKLNLYSTTRGINRFKGLVLSFQVMEKMGYQMPPYDGMARWTEQTKELSNPALEAAIKETGDEQLKMLLEWSKEVNIAINSLSEIPKAFPNVWKGLGYISKVADIVIVSSANGSAVLEEWTTNGLADDVCLILGQEAGSKAYCISSLIQQGYSKDEVLMVGDALGDLDAAKQNDVLFYPILVNQEAQSWEKLVLEAAPTFIKGSYRGEYQQGLIKAFYDHFEQQ